ncbi:hypothetical protein SAMN02745121_02686 [Nannocystis exedens]|uniref:Uncharacterized protein n=1 Tax=Nannocystis exedens TaxID=54 RepID=A0A1I1X251_9BACT|nr:hypothetical protein [Nannocystis exedens]PCC70848.1 hypothetical protein NAEX_03912 [Nannocystis exedens]SFE01495.1 hypothetical protein SAMN02745121_02686 [Nannocystis exedens]
MAANQSPQLGYNHNIPHRGRLYHVQTEDSGIQKAHIFTHVFYDGTIIATNKVDYRDKLESENLDAVIVAAMQDSHKSMIRQLRSGSFDERIVKYIGAHPEASNKPEVAAPVVQEKAPAKRPDRRPPPEPREVVPQGPPLAAGEPGPTLDPTLGHVVFTAPEAQAQVAASAAGQGPPRPSRGPSRVGRRPIGGIGGQGVTAGTPIAQRRDVIVGKFASEHQHKLDDEILALLAED